jgi:ArsR family transcriptional regulator
MVDEDCVERLKVLADATRLQVLRELMGGALHVGELNARIPIRQNLLSHHLRTLREAGLVEAQRDGKSVLYALAEGVGQGKRRPAIDLGCCKISFDD